MENETDGLRSIRYQFFGYLIGMFLTFSSYCAILNLQSSINIEDGLGTISVAASYISCDIFLVFFTTIGIRKFGAKNCLLASEFTYLIYVVINLYPEFYTLIPAAILVGAGEGTIWPCMTLVNYYFATQYATARKHETKKNEFYVNLFSGYFFTFLQASQVFGNLVAYLVLYVFASNTSSKETPENGNKSTTASWMTSFTEVDKLQYCGSQDCQNMDTVNNSLNQYVPASDIALIILISILTAMCIASITCHWIFVPNNITVSLVSETYDDEVRESANDNVNLSFELKEVDVEINHHALKPNNCENQEYTYDQYSLQNKNVVDEQLGIEETGDDNTKQNISQETITEDTVKDTTYLTALKDFGEQLSKTSQILLIPITFYMGMTEAFVFSELTRAFTSCVVGVEMVGIHMATYGFSDAILSFVVGKFGQKLGRTPFFVIAAIIDLCVYTYCLLWDPNLDMGWTIFLIYFAFGITDGIWQTLLNVLYMEYFEGSHDVAITSWTFWITVGFALQFGWSTSICVYIKIWVQVGLLILGITAYGIGDYMYRKKKSMNVEIEETRL